MPGQVGSFSLCTLSDVMDYLEINQAEEHGRISDIINAVSNDCERFCRRQFLKRTHTQNYDGDGTDTLCVESYPIVSIASLVLYDGGTAIASTDYHIYAAAGMVVLKYAVFPCSNRGIAIVYDGGFNGVDNLPFGLRRSVVEGSAYKYSEMKNKQVGIVTSSFRGGEEVITRPDAKYPKSVTDTWNQFRRPMLHEGSVAS